MGATPPSTPIRPLVALAGCAETVAGPLSGTERQAFLDSLEVEPSRPFALGFTPWPHAAEA